MSEVQKVLDLWGEKLVQSVRMKLTAGKKFATGNLVNSLDYKYTYQGGKYTIQITGAPYLINVDKGRRPYGRGQLVIRRGIAAVSAPFPPISKILAWIKLKRFKLKKGETWEQKAYVVARGIAARGIKPFPVLNEGNKVIKSAAFKKDITSALKKDLGKQLNLQQLINKRGLK